MSIRCFVVASFLFIVFASSAAHGEKATRPNILLLYADDWRHDTLGVAGNPIVKTPHLDRLAGEGLRFTHACVTTSVCGVSRANLYTGQWAARNGCAGFNMFKTPWEQTYPGLLRANGYWVGHVGKWHNGNFPADNFDFARSYYGRHFIKQKDGSEIHVTTKNEQDALEYLRTRPKEKPFYLTVSFFAAHAEDANPKQFLYQPDSTTLYENVKIPVPKTATEEAFKRLPPFLATEQNEGRKRWHWRFDTPQKYQESMKAYYRLVTEVDATCGRLLKELDAQSLRDNTIVIFTTDNGYFHAERGLADKWYPYEESIRVPLMVRDPRMAASRVKTINDDFVLSVDLAPFILKAAGIEPPDSMQGRDFSPLYLAEKKPDWRKEFYYEHPTIGNKNRIPRSEALVRKDVKYIWWPEWEHEELFDLLRDPQEQQNLVGDAAYAETLAKMRLRFKQLKAEVE